MLTKPPSAELRPDQRDDESLPPYEVLDPVLAGYVEGDRSADDLVAAGFDPAAVARVVALVDRAEYKRRQMPPGVRISAKAFGKDRRMPITNHYRSPWQAGAVRAHGPGHPAARRRPLSERTGAEVADPPEPELAHRPGRGGATRCRCRVAALIGGEYRWIETASSAARRVGDRHPHRRSRVHLDAQSMRHAWHAELWADRLPVMAGVRPGRADPPVAPDAPPCSPS